MSQQRVPIGIPGVDVALSGGLIAGRSYLLAGSAGTGKTVFSLQWLIHGRAAGKSCLYIALSEPGGDVSANISAFGWSLEGISVADLTPADSENGAALENYQIFPSSDVENLPYWQKIFEALDAYRPDFVVVDSLSNLRYVATDEYQFRRNVLHLISLLNQRRCTTLLLYEPLELARDSSVGLAVDGILRLHLESVEGLRHLQIEKTRGSDFLHGMHPLHITCRGIQVFPHIVEQVGATVPGQYCTTSGIEGLDSLLCGGLESGTTTLASGPSGVGKSTVCTVFARQSIVSRGNRAVYYSFEESRESLLARCGGLGIDIDSLLQDGSLKFVNVNPLQLYPDEFLHKVRNEVEGEGCKFVVIDSLRGYQITMQKYGTPIAHLRNLTTYLNRQGVTTLITNVEEGATGSLREIEMGMSHLADNIFLMRYAELEGSVIKVIGCLKKRTGPFESELRELVMSAGQGVQVGQVLKGTRRILAGPPVAEDSGVLSGPGKASIVFSG